MELREFQGLALRTESRIDGIKLDRHNLVLMLKLVVAITEILDGVKKSAFYKKNTKIETDFAKHISDILKIASELSWLRSGRGSVETVVDENEQIANIDPRVFHGIIGIITESGELASALLKAVQDPNYTIDAVNIQEECCDISWYKAILHDALELDWVQGLKNVINKLRIRYPDKYSDENAENRNLEAERIALEAKADDTAAIQQQFVSMGVDPGEADWSVTARYTV